MDQVHGMMALCRTVPARLLFQLVIWQAPSERHSLTHRTDKTAQNLDTIAHLLTRGIGARNVTHVGLCLVRELSCIV